MSKWIAEFELEDGDKMPEHMDLEYHGVKLDFHCKPLEQEPCEDAVSRAEVKKIAKEMYLEVANMELDTKTISDCISCTSSKCREVLESKLQDLQSIKTQEQRKGHWIEHPHECGINWEYPMYECSECHGWTEDDSDFCPNCGADMREEQEWQTKK